MRRSAAFTWSGLEEQYGALRALPGDLTRIGEAMARRQAGHAAARIAASYAVRTGKLRGGVEVAAAKVKGQYMAGVVVRSRTRYAGTYDKGTKGPRQTRAGKNRGEITGAFTFDPIMDAAQRAYFNDLLQLLAAQGLKATAA